MKVCLLVCDHVKAHWVPTHGAYPAMFRKLLPDLELEPYFVCDGFFPEVRDFDAYICTGSRFSVYDAEDWIDSLASLFVDVERLAKKLVGVCFGHQMIAHALGGKVEKAGVGWNIGVHSFRVLQRSQWMHPSASQFKVCMLCQDQVTRLPLGASVLADSADCPFGMFQLGDHFLGIQGHPEFTTAYNKAVYESRASLIGEKKIEEANQTIEKAVPDSTLLASWMMAFLQS